MVKALRLSLEIKEQKPEQTQRLKVALINALKTYEKVTIFQKELTMHRIFYVLL